MDETEKQLITRLLSRDPSAVKEFYDTYSPLLLRFIRQRVGDEHDVEEITQDTLFAFLDKSRDFNGNSRLSTYLCSIAKHKIVDFYRKRKLKKIVFSQLAPGLETLIASSADPEKELTNKFVKEKIRSVFTKLSPHYAQILQLKYVEGRSVSEIADILACSFKSAESVLFRARKAFVELYTGE